MFFGFFVCLSITLLNGRVWANDFIINAFEYGNDFDIVGWGRFVDVHMHSTKSLPQNAEVENMAKFGVFHPQKRTQ